MAREILDSDDSDTEEINQLTINEHYAKAFEYRKEREELAKLKEKYGSDAEEGDDEEDSEEAESEDEDGEELTPAVDAAILRTLARIKRKDPAIYQQGKDVFEEEVQKTGEAKMSTKARKDKSKPLTIKQQNLAVALNPDSRSPSPEPITHVQEQKDLRNETIAAFHTAVGGVDDDDDDDLLVPREKTKDELEQEEEEYRDFLKREVGTDLKELITVEEGSSAFIQEEPEETKGKKKEKKSKKSKENKTEADQEFLMNYILNRGWIDRSAKRLPTYSEITGSTSKGKGKARADSPMDEDEDEDEVPENENEDGPDEVEDEEFEEIVDRFESSYNFRFEEPGADQIARYPRNIDSLVRRQDSGRKDERERRKARKEEEMLKKQEEVKRLKALKMKEIRSKLERIGKEGGKKVDEDLALQELDLEGDWDPEAHEKQMAKIYGNDEGDEFVDDEKPTWDDDVDITDIIPEEAESSSKKKKKKKKKAEEKQVYDGVDIDEMDADVVKTMDDDEWDGTEEMRKRKLDEYMDELYELEFNDVVAGMPTRFKYAKVQSQSFALNPVEILLATDAELNEYMGLKKYAPYRKDSSNWDKNRASRLKELKDKVGERSQALGAGKGLAEVLPEKPAKKRKGKKERMREKAAVEQEVDMEEGAGQEDASVGQTDKGAKRKAADEQPTSGQAATDESSKRKRRRHKKTSNANDV